VAALMAVADAALDAKKYEEAKQGYLAVLRLERLNVAAMINLGVAYDGIGGEDNLEEARAAYERALQLDTSKLTKEFQAILVNNLGVVYQKQGKLKEAVQQYTRALELNPNYQDAKDNLARAKERL